MFYLLYVFIFDMRSLLYYCLSKLHTRAA